METVTVGGKPRVHSISHYLPPCLEVLENPWIQWVCLLPRELDEPLYEKARKMGYAAIEALGLDDGMTHMEWFERADGTPRDRRDRAASAGREHLADDGLAHDIDPYRAWARAVIDGELDAPWERKIRGRLRVPARHGTGPRRLASPACARANEAVGKCIAEAKLPAIGATKADSYEGDGYVVVRTRAPSGAARAEDGDRDGEASLRGVSFSRAAAVRGLWLSQEAFRRFDVSSCARCALTRETAPDP